MRQKFVAGNWKMFGNKSTARQLAADVARAVGNDARVRVAICPPFPYLSLVGEALQGSVVELGAQNAYCEKEGAFTGEISPWMLADAGCRWVILGHSERRHKLGESDALINRKVLAALAAGLHVILCVGETLEERQAGMEIQVLRSQLAGSLVAVKASDLKQLVVAYEPVWAIGTGQNATPEQAQEAHAHIRNEIRQVFGEEPARGLPIQYGGSVKPNNAATLFQQPDVDGGLIGGASLNAADFLAIVQAAR